MSDFIGLPVACNRDCGATCALVAVTGRDAEPELRTNPLNHSLKKPCPRGLRSIESRNASDRLTVPLIQSGPRGSGEFKPASWDDALALAAERLSEIAERHGPESILNMGGSGACKGALHHTGRLTSRFLNQLGAVTWLNGSYSFQAASFVLPYMFGSLSSGYDARTLIDTRFVILWGANIADTRFGNETEGVIRHIREAGGEVVVIDPRKTQTAKHLGTTWIPIRPGNDSAAMLAIAWVLFDEGMADTSFISTHVHGAQELQAHVTGQSDGLPKTPEWAERHCGIPAETLRDLARSYGRARPAALIPGFSIQRALGGEDAFRMAVALQAITGNAGRAGGTPGTNTWVTPPGPSVPVCAAPGPTGRWLPKAIWPREILNSQREPGGVSSDLPGDHSNVPVRPLHRPEPAIRAAYVCGTNYLNQGSDIQMNIEAFNSLELVVCHELFLTPTARYADIIFPATHFLERDDLITAEDNYLYYSAQIFEPVGESRDDFDIYADLSHRLGFSDSFDEGRTKGEWLDRIIDASAVTAPGRAEFKRTGIFDGGDHERYGLATFIRDPVGHPLDTPSGKIEISSESYAETTGFPAWPEFRPATRNRAFPLMLVSPHSRLRINSTGSNMEWIRRGDPIVLQINSRDAADRNVVSGTTVAVQSEVGTMYLDAHVTDDIMPGVVSCPEGAWYVEESVGAQSGDGAVNRVTPLDPTLPSMGTRTHSVFVEVSPAAAHH